MTANNQPSSKPGAGGAVAFLVIIVLLFVIIAAVVSAFSGDDDGDSSGSNEIGAEVMCEEFVKERLKSPASAEFSDTRSISTGTPDEYEVTGSVDSENGFGAMLRSSYECTIRDNGDDTWTLIAIDLG